MKNRILPFILLISSLLYAIDTKAAFPVLHGHTVNATIKDKAIAKHIKVPDTKNDSDIYAILALVSLFVFPPLAIVFGAIGMNEKLPRHKLALTCLIIGAVYTAIVISAIVVMINAMSVRR